jgi:hypothetical protein
MNDAGDFAKLVPGFDFLQGLMKNAGAALPGMGQWIAPTLNPEELDKRIQELRTVQFWLEQNARMLAATIQALEVQRMTLSTLKTMNMPVADMADAFKIRMPEAASPAPPPPAPAPTPAAKTAPKPAPRRSASAPAASPSGATPGVVDPLQWWGALTQQFTELAARTMKETSADAAKNLAGTLVKQSIDAAGKTFEAAAAPAAAVKRAAPAPARKRAGKTSR